jgi:hypothetical protein
MAGKEWSYEKYIHGGKGALVAFEERYIFELNRTNSIFPSRKLTNHLNIPNCASYIH